MSEAVLVSLTLRCHDPPPSFICIRPGGIPRSAGIVGPVRIGVTVQGPGDGGFVTGARGQCAAGSIKQCGCGSSCLEPQARASRFQAGPRVRTASFADGGERAVQLRFSPRPMNAVCIRFTRLPSRSSSPRHKVTIQPYLHMATLDQARPTPFPGQPRIQVGHCPGTLGPLGQ